MTMTFLRPFVWPVVILTAGALYLTISYREIAVPDFVPAFSLPSAHQGSNDVAIPEHPGRPILLNFFASWCHICDREEPTLKKLDKVLSDANGELIGIAMHDSRSALVQSGKLLARPFRVGIDRRGDLARQLRIDGVPQTILIDQAGKIVYHLRGQLETRHVDVIAQHLTAMRDPRPHSANGLK